MSRYGLIETKAPIANVAAMQLRRSYLDAMPTIAAFRCFAPMEP